MKDSWATIYLGLDWKHFNALRFLEKILSRKQVDHFLTKLAKRL